MEKLKDKIEKYINKTGVIRTPAYFIKDLFNDILVWIERNINNFFLYITNIHDYLDKGFTVIYDNDDPNTYSQIINSDYKNKAFILENNKIVSGYKIFPKGYTEYHFITECYDNLFYVPSYQPEHSLISQIKLSNTIEYIGKNFFANQTKLTEIIIPNSVKEIRDGAFRNCTGITSITIPNSVTYIGDNVFEGCVNLIEINIGNSVTYIGNECFKNCTSLTSLNLNNVTEIGSDIIYGCTNIESLEINNVVMLPGFYIPNNSEKALTIYGRSIKHIEYISTSRILNLHVANLKSVNDISTNSTTYNVHIYMDIRSFCSLDVNSMGNVELYGNDGVKITSIDGNYHPKYDTISNVKLNKVSIYDTYLDSLGLNVEDYSEITIRNSYIHENKRLLTTVVPLSSLNITNIYNWVQSKFSHFPNEITTMLLSGSEPSVIEITAPTIERYTLRHFSKVEKLYLSKNIIAIDEDLRLMKSLKEIYYAGTIEQYRKIKSTYPMFKHDVKLYLYKQVVDILGANYYEYYLYEDNSLIIDNDVNINIFTGYYSIQNLECIGVQEAIEILQFNNLENLSIINSNVSNGHDLPKLKNIIIENSMITNFGVNCENIENINIDDISRITNKNAFNDYFINKVPKLSNDDIFTYFILGSNLINFRTDDNGTNDNIIELSNVKYICSYVFENYTKYPIQLNLPNLEFIDSGAFNSAYSVTLYTGDKLKLIYGQAFYKVNYLNFTTTSKGLKYIGYLAFSNIISNNIHLTIPENIVIDDFPSGATAYCSTTDYKKLDNGIYYVDSTNSNRLYHPKHWYKYNKRSYTCIIKTDTEVVILNYRGKAIWSNDYINVEGLSDNGIENTEKIITTLGEGNYAANVASDIRTIFNIESQYWLPSTTELSTYIPLIDSYGYSDGNGIRCWSSNQDDSDMDRAYLMRHNYLTTETKLTTNLKTNSMDVIAISKINIK